MKRVYGVRLAEAMLNERYRLGLNEQVKLYAKIGGEYRQVTEITPIYHLDGSVQRYNITTGYNHHWHAYPSDLLFYVFTRTQLLIQIGLEHANR